MLLNHVYKFTVSQPTFGSLTNEQVNRLFRDGRMSKFLELQMTDYFPTLNYVDKHGHDYEMKMSVPGFENMIEMKCFTKQGLKYMPSNMIGAKRTLDVDVFHEKAKNLTYLFCDISEFPEIRVVFKSGNEMIEKFPRGRITPTHKDEIFSD